MKELVKEAGIRSQKTFHCARHTIATKLITNGAGIYTVKALMGHRDIRSTMIYAKLVDNEAIDNLPSITLP